MRRRSTGRRIVRLPFRGAPGSPVRLRVARQGGDDARLGRDGRVRRDDGFRQGRPRSRPFLRARIVRSMHALPRGRALARGDARTHPLGRRTRIRYRDSQERRAPVDGDQPVSARRFDRAVLGLGRASFRRSIQELHQNAYEGRIMKTVTLTIDGVSVTVPEGTLLVEAAKQIQQEIPVYCYHPKLGPAGLCRICLVEIEKMPKLQIACNTPVADGMVVHTMSERAAEGRRAVLEFLLLNHPLDCPICDKGGECDLQDYAMAYGQGASRLADAKMRKPKAVDLGPTIVLDEERCILCLRCVRFDEIITRERELVLKDRGVRNIIATATGEPYRHNFTGNVTELCPVGALTSKTYRFKSRPWDLRRTTTTCMQCSVGCQLHVDVRVGKVMRTMSVQTDDAISDTWLCDRGRYNIGFYEGPQRVTQPLYKQNGAWVQIGWDDALQIWATAINEAVKANAKSVGVIGGGRLTNEEAYVLQHVFRAKGVSNLDWRAGRQRQASPGRASGKLTDLEDADAIIEIGESPDERAPTMDLRVRKAAFQKGAKLIRIASL